MNLKYHHLAQSLHPLSVSVSILIAAIGSACKFYCFFLLRFLLEQSSWLERNRQRVVLKDGPHGSAPLGLHHTNRKRRRSARRSPNSRVARRDNNNTTTPPEGQVLAGSLVGTRDAFRHLNVIWPQAGGRSSSNFTFCFPSAFNSASAGEST